MWEKNLYNYLNNRAEKKGNANEVGPRKKISLCYMFTQVNTATVERQAISSPPKAEPCFYRISYGEPGKDPETRDHINEQRKARS